MNYLASVTDFFKSPKWMMNTLLAGLCVFIPFVGPIVIKGWLITGFWGRDDERCEIFPDFDFNNFGKYLERGLWPFLVTLVSGLVLGMILAVFIVPLVMVTTLLIPTDNGGAAGGCAAALLVVIMTVFYFTMVMALMVVLTPLTVRASITQDFAQSFNMAFVKRFISLTWKEILLSSVFLIAASLILCSVGALVLCIGMYFATVPVYFCWVHLQKQLYALYLSRGGEPIPLSPKLRDYPPPAPAV